MHTLLPYGTALLHSMHKGALHVGIHITRATRQAQSHHVRDRHHNAQSKWAARHANGHYLDESIIAASDNDVGAVISICDCIHIIHVRWNPKRTLQ